MLFASSASAGHRFAICAVSNCVKAGSLRSVLDVKKGSSRRLPKKRRLFRSLSNGAGGIRCVEFGERLDVFKSFVVHTARRLVRDDGTMSSTPYTVSGASLSLFSRRYLTSEMSRHPALLNSVKIGRECRAACLHFKRPVPGPSFRAAASSSSACGRCFNRVAIRCLFGCGFGK